eukprot:gene7350-11725_t
MEAEQAGWSADEAYAAERTALIATITQSLVEVAGKLVTVKDNLEKRFAASPNTSPVRIPLATMDDALAINYGHHCKCLCWSTGVLADNSGQMAELASAWKVQTAISRLGN